MFKSIRYGAFVGLNSNGQSIYKFLIVDSEFETTVESTDPILLSVFIEQYEKRNFNVAANLAILAKTTNTVYKISFDKIFRSWESNCPEYRKYEDEINKYLVLID